MKEYNIIYDQLFNRFRNPYWNLLQLNSQNIYYSESVPNPYLFDTSLFNYYTLQNIELDPFPYVLQYNAYNNLSMGIGMNEKMTKNSPVKEELRINPENKPINLENKV